MITEALLIGLVAGFICYELFDVSPGGIVSPGYLALFIGEPLRLGTTVLIALIVWILIEVLSKHLILYGKRKFLLALLTGFLLKMLSEQVIMPGFELQTGLMSIGYIIPGLIASEMSRQKPVPTLLALGIVTLFTALVILIIR